MSGMSDSELHIRVVEELASDPRLRHGEIGVAVQDGVVTLSGTLDSHAARAAAAHAVERISGVRAVANGLTAPTRGGRAWSDTEIAHAAARMLEWSSEVPPGAVVVRVEHGWVIIEGIVESHYQRAAAEAVVARILGVKGVSNLIAIKSVTPAAVLKERIRAAFRRVAAQEADGLAVETVGDRTTLSGQVHSWCERQAAEEAAWNAGAGVVLNRITVGPAVRTRVDHLVG